MRVSAQSLATLYATVLNWFLPPLTGDASLKQHQSQSVKKVSNVSSDARIGPHIAVV
jgi:hypothetical protein